MENNNTYSRFLLKVDISGIQNFIFDIPSDKASKNLKARSFCVYSLTHFAETFFKQNFSHPSAEIIYNGGGNFLAYLWANENDLKNKIDEFQTHFLQSDIYPFIAYIKADGNDFDEQNKQLSILLTIEKSRRKLSFTTFDPEIGDITWDE
ncbi:MAG: CRISPR-associated protein Csm1, partial [Anaerophaga sp.]|nr:CRISPR-associated protein Csm1 [Anaerophaga sp.]